MVGSDRPQLGVLLFPRHLPPDDDLLEMLDDHIKRANESSPSYAQIAPEMCYIMTDSAKASALPKSSKGTIQRGVANDVFKAEIDGLYAGTGDKSGGQKVKRSLDEMKVYIRDLILRVAGKRQKAGSGLVDDTDLFGWGVDSLMAMRIRTAAQKVRPLEDPYSSG